MPYPGSRRIANAVFHILLSVNKAFDILVEYMPFDCIPNIIGKHTDVMKHPDILFLCPQIFRQNGISAGPSLTIENDGWVDLMQPCTQFVQGDNIQNPHKIKAKSVNMILFCPVAHGFYNIFADHRVFRCHFISAGRSIGIPLSIFSEKVIRFHLLKATVINIKGVIVYHVHDNAKACLMQCLYHLLKLPDADFSVERIRAIRPLRHIIIHRIIAPVILLLVRLRLINTSEIKRRHQLYMCHAQFQKMIQP